MNLFQTGNFTLHAGEASPFKIDCDALTQADWQTLAALVAARVQFGRVHGIPTGGCALAAALEPYATTGPLLIVDDVLTTGTSMEAARAAAGEPCVGVVVFARREPPDWIQAVFRLW